MEIQFRWIIFILTTFCLSLLIAINLPLQVVNAEVLKNGATWTLNGNGHIGKLIVSYTTQGSVTGSIYNPNEQIIGFWDNNSQKIIFMRISNPSDPSSFQVYTGYLFKDVRQFDGSQKCYQTLTGSFLTPAGAGGSATKNEYGWYAQTPIPCR